MRSIGKKVLLLTALAVVFLTATAAAADLGTGVVAADSLRVRGEPSTDAATVTYLLDGTQVQVLAALDGWYQVSYGDYTGYVSADYLIYTPADGAAAQETAAAVEATVAAATETVSAVSTGAGSASAVIDGECSYVNLRSAPSTDSEILTTIDEGSFLELHSVDEAWCFVTYDGQAGYVNAEYVYSEGISVLITEGIVTGDCVNVRSGPGTDYSIAGKVYAGERVTLTALADGWYAITDEDSGVSGYIRGDYIREYVPGEASSIGEAVVEEAMKYLGVPYAYGGASPSGFDCSGFTMYIYSLFSYSLPHSATSQWNSSGEYVDRSDLQPGDLVMFCDPSRSNGKACSHVGIYIGNNEFIHASSGSSGQYIRISSLSEDYYDGYYKGAKRIG